MKDKIATIFYAVLILIFVALCICLYAYKVNDCLKVGHSTFYCVSGM